MKRLLKHGDFIELGQVVPMGALNDFGYMFPIDLERLPSDDPAARMALIKGLTDLGAIITTKPAGGDSPISSAFTYLGQFVDHDLTLSAMRHEEIISIDNPDFNVIDPAQIGVVIRNLRTGTNDIDSVYNTAALTTDEHFVLGLLDGQAGGVTEGNDLPRAPDKTPLIGDARNDENLAVAQTHVAFLKFHNAVMDKEGKTALEARKIVTQHYQWILLHDFLRNIADPAYLNNVLMFGNRFFKPGPVSFFLPLEFSMAAYRLGHSMVRNNYDFNSSFPTASLNDLFTFSSSGGAVPAPLVWKIDWSRFNGNKAKKIDTDIVNPLASVPGLGINLAARNLRRGYMFNLPTGQAVADFVLGDKSLILSPEEILAISTPDERTVLEANNFHIKSPLWYYILKEAEVRSSGNRLGPVGTAIVTEVFVETIRGGKFSILKERDWRPTLPATVPGTFTMEDMLKYTGLL